ncbi:enoyl-ACP reductase FabI [Anaeromicrobium sediminis]|uniref:Enoyl-[acyl-carrier-protein] reductase [NADH] n=1 Tax=Anaeromicrobium sediminis TaxID=1478221 RepID=A0A267MG82_9FIRM|nr:enoyl-ACP reductase FabI [Anaeromicrobium sediminis]PAB58591.1 enoyl-[acyl-carrier-protein] reductase [Anaeromicrobium sediminis]
MSGLLKGKNILIMGVANKRSIAWGIAQELHKHGANLAFTYVGERSLTNLEKLLSDDMKDAKVYECDVTNDENVAEVFGKLKEDVGVLHGLVHAIAHSKKEELAGNFYDTSRDGFKLANDISAYSFVLVTKHAQEIMTEGGSILTLTYLGAERAIPNYNVMGVAKAALEASTRYLAKDLGEREIRVNAISAGPIKTLAARGVKDFNDLLKQAEDKIPRGRTVDPKEVGGTAVFLCSDLSTGVTGEVIHVDAGFSMVG